MKLFAQHGYGEGEKINNGFNEKLISGVIFGAKDINPDRLGTRLSDIKSNYPKTDRLFDPQYYVSLIASDPNSKLGKLDEYPFFKPRRRSQLESNELVINETNKVFEFQMGLPVTAIIAPNILISRSFDSVEAVISKSFIRQAKKVSDKFNYKKPVYATLAVSREALIDRKELESFLNDITLMDNPPDGFYLLIAARNVDSRYDMYNADVIAAWMLLNYSLKINGFQVINGYSDIISPFLGAVGGDIGCTGWWSNLRTFSLDRFAPEASGGRLPVQRYLSTSLLNRVTFIELNALRKLVPQIVNGLPSDKEYDEEPERAIEVLQSWDALGELLSSMTNSDNLADNIFKCEKLVEAARRLYSEIKLLYRLDPKSDDSHLDALEEGIKLFKRLAEV